MELVWTWKSLHIWLLHLPLQEAEVQEKTGSEELKGRRAAETGAVAATPSACTSSPPGLQACASLFLTTAEVLQIHNQKHVCSSGTQKPISGEDPGLREGRERNPTYQIPVTTFY